MEITDLSILRKWENLKNWQCIKYLFAPLCLQCPREMIIVSQSVLYAVFFFKKKVMLYSFSLFHNNTFLNPLILNI